MAPLLQHFGEEEIVPNVPKGNTLTIFLPIPISRVSGSVDVHNEQDLFEKQTLHVFSIVYTRKVKKVKNVMEHLSSNLD